MIKCDVCGIAKEDVKLVTDPYIQEFYDQDIKMYMCVDCERIRYFAI